MNVNRIVQVSNHDPVRALQDFLAAWWERYGLGALLAPVERADYPGVEVLSIEESAALSRVNPFIPLLQGNSAGAVEAFVRSHPGKRLAVLLRPCELRSLVELQKRGRLSPPAQEVVVIGVDCLGTFPLSELAREQGPAGLQEATAQVLRNAAEGGLRPQRFRTACQICDWPAPCGADVTIGMIGVESGRYLLVVARDEEVDSRLDLPAVTAGLASEYQVSHRETVVGAVADMRAGVRRQLLEQAPGERRFGDLGSILAWFAACSACGQCLAACPIYEGEIDGLLAPAEASTRRNAPLEQLAALGRWLASCSGCGMCEEACSSDVPLTLLISALSHRVRGEIRYRCGDPIQRLPWMHP